MKWDEFFFSFNSIQFAVWYWGISLLYLMKFWKRISFLSYSIKRNVTWQTSFSLHDYHHTSNNKRVFPTMTLLSTSFFQHLFIFQQFEPSITFTFDSIIAILKSRQMNRLFLLINYIQSIESLGWRREGEKVSDKMKMNENAFYQKVKLSM